MSEWKTYKLGDVVDMRNGKKRPKEAGNFPVYGGNGILDYTNQYNAENVIVVGRVGAYCGSVYRCKQKCWVSDNAICVNSKPIIDDNFLFYLMSSLDFHHFHIGGAQPLMTQDIIGSFEISLPPLEEQKRIADILSAIDDKIELNRRINANLEQQAQALYKSWFVDNKNDDWEEVELGDIATILAGGDKPEIYVEKQTDDCKVPIYSNGIDNEGLFGYTRCAKIYEHSITISARGTIGFVCLRTEPYVPIVRLISVIPQYNNLSAEYLYLWAITQNISGTGTTQQQLTIPYFKKTKIIIPNQELLIKFNKVISPIFITLKKNKTENYNLSNLRDTLLPKLMSGEIKA